MPPCRRIRSPAARARWARRRRGPCPCPSHHRAVHGALPVRAAVRASGPAPGPPPDIVRCAARPGAKLADGRRVPMKSREWIMRQKEKRRRQGKSVANDSRYTGRSRGPRF